jgi:Subtilase family
MPTADPVRQYIVFDAEKLLDRSVHGLLRIAEVVQALENLIGPGLPYSVESLPAARFVPYQPLELPHAPQTVAVLTSPDESAAQAVRAAFDNYFANWGRTRISDISVDPGIAMADYSFPGAADVGLFGTRKDAHRLVGIDALPGSLDGSGVNVVVIDSGLDASTIPFGQWGGGWQPLPAGRWPGTTTGTDALHGAMIVRNILAVAPRARIWDLPLILPPRINALGTFLSGAQATFDLMLSDISAIQKMSSEQHPWVFVNAWAIFDRRSEKLFFREYTENRPGSPLPHPFIQRIEVMVQNGFDMIFCAGNCGGVCPDGRCGPNDFGPGRGIWGANAHESVLTVGAARTDGSWFGYSSEGPGPTPKLAHDKPDLSAPSQFSGTAGEYPESVGTSGAAALAAGVVAAFRSKWGQTAVPPQNLIGALNATATRINGPAWSRRVGNGILNARAAMTALPP